MVKLFKFLPASDYFCHLLIMFCTVLNYPGQPRQNVWPDMALICFTYIHPSWQFFSKFFSNVDMFSSVESLFRTGSTQKNIWTWLKNTHEVDWDVKHQPKIDTLMVSLKKGKWVWSGNTTITHCRSTNGTVRKSHRTLTLTRHQEDS